LFWKGKTASFFSPCFKNMVFCYYL
jgi:hypothetical protein